MEKLKMHTPDLTQDHVARIGELFPNCVTEARDESGKLKLAIDFDQLKQELSDSIVEGAQERYHLNWPGKREALLTANAPIAKTLRPCREESVDFDTTQNLFIEGDNLDALKLLQETYLGKVKMIYIDPPYNRRDDLLYCDDYSEDNIHYLQKTNQVSEEGIRFVANTESDGRFHSKWLSMIMPRLKVASRLLRDDGVIVISIDFNENHRLRELCDEVFGRNNFLSEVTISTGANQSGDGVKIQKNAEICLVYAKSKDATYINRIDNVQESLRNLNDAPSPLSTRLDMGFTIYYHPEKTDFQIRFDYDKSKVNLNDINKVYTNDNDLIKKGYVPIRPGFRGNQLHRWRWGAETVIDRKDQLVFEKKSGEEWSVSFKQSGLNPPKNIWSFSSGTSELSSLFSDDKVFDYPKSIKFMSYITALFGTPKNVDETALVLDFFAGSGSYAHGVYAQSASDGITRQIINVQYPETLDKDDKDQKLAFEACVKHKIEPKNIAEICKERLRRAGKKVAQGECHKSWNKDVGFRVLKIDTSNMAEVYYTPDKVQQATLFDAVNNIKPDRTPEDLLFQVLLDWGVDLTLPIAKKTVLGKTVFFVNDATYDLIACFDMGITEELVKELAAEKPLRVVFCDNGFVSDAVKINAEQIFKQLSPTTDVKSI